jgi:hypothetical protein
MVANILPKRLPSIKSGGDKSLQRDLAGKQVSRLPTTTTLNVDPKTLNLHLALRVKEIIACSESMWEWVEQFQRESAATSVPNLKALSNWSLDTTRCAILDMTREDFDLLLNNFTLQVPVLNKFLAFFPQFFFLRLILGTSKTRLLLVMFFKNDSIGTSSLHGVCRIEYCLINLAESIRNGFQQNKTNHCSNLNIDQMA